MTSDGPGPEQDPLGDEGGPADDAAPGRHAHEPRIAIVPTLLTLLVSLVLAGVVVLLVCDLTGVV